MNIEAYLSFGGNCEAAMKFYEQALGGKIAMIHRFGGSPMDDGKLPMAWKEKVMHATLEAEGAKLMASDGMPGQPAPSYSGFSVSINVRDKVRAEKVFNALAAGGKVQMPFAPTFWAQGFGMLTDKFGVPWMVNCDAAAQS